MELGESFEYFFKLYGFNHDKTLNVNRTKLLHVSYLIDINKKLIQNIYPHFQNNYI